MDALLTVTDVSLRFGGVHALARVSFDVWPAETFAVIGPNGAGKTSMLNCLSGVCRPSGGAMSFAGTELVARRPARIAALGVSRTFQNLGLFGNLDVVDNLMLGRHHLMRSGFIAALAYWGRCRREELAHREAVEQIVDLLDLGAHRGRPVEVLPYGVQKRIELGRALAMEPRLLLLDEPVAGMNRHETDAMSATIPSVQAATGVAVVIVEHDMRMVMELADRVMVLDFGAPIVTGDPASVQSDSRVIEAYLGEPIDEPTGPAVPIRAAHS